jgi:glycine/D-amino acid oxidase-like deaminating enzyme
MTSSIKTEIAIVGAGVIGLATALRLAAAGREVVVIDPNEPGSGASYGNAGVLAPHGCAPIGNPDTLRQLGLPFSNEASANCCQILDPSTPNGWAFAHPCPIRCRSSGAHAEAKI